MLVWRYRQFQCVFGLAQRLRVKRAQSQKLKRLQKQAMLADHLEELDIEGLTLERAEEQGALIVNKPQSLRDCNEKLFTAWFLPVRFSHIP